jgi:hypothetical protein
VLNLILAEPHYAILCKGAAVRLPNGLIRVRSIRNSKVAAPEGATGGRPLPFRRPAPSEGGLPPVA